MNERQSISNVVRLALAMIVVHAAVATLHGAAHRILGIELSPLQTLYVVLVITLAPLAAGLLLWKRIARAGAIVLACSMAGASVFGAYNHFVAISADHVAHLSSATHGGWVVIFQATAIMLAFIEPFGVWIGLRALEEKQGAV